MAWDEWNDADLYVKSLKEDYSGGTCAKEGCDKPLSIWDEQFHKGHCPYHWRVDILPKEFPKPSIRSEEVPF